MRSTKLFRSVPKIRWLIVSTTIVVIFGSLIYVRKLFLGTKLTVSKFITYEQKDSSFTLAYPAYLGKPRISFSRYGNPTTYFDFSQNSNIENRLYAEVELHGIQRGGVIAGILFEGLAVKKYTFNNYRFVIREYIVSTTSKEAPEYNKGKFLVDASLLSKNIEVFYIKNSKPLNSAELLFAENTILSIAKSFQIKH